ncbi:MAG: hypothetical protein Q4C03_01485 [bacterium]|nr:hypothetical protein [bacterium]MDO5462652.1 hypothetical protein [bacterium]
MRKPTQKQRFSSRAGQAFAELTITLLVFVALFVGVVTYRQIAVKQHYARRDARVEAGVDALRHGPEGWVSANGMPETRMHIMHRINAYNRLEEARPLLLSNLPSSAYTLASRDIPEAELGLTTTTEEKIVPLHHVFADFIYGKDSVKIKETVTFPSATNLWR